MKKLDKQENAVSSVTADVYDSSLKDIAGQLGNEWRSQACWRWSTRELLRGRSTSSTRRRESQEWNFVKISKAPEKVSQASIVGCYLLKGEKCISKWCHPCSTFDHIPLLSLKLLAKRGSLFLKAAEEGTKLCQSRL